MASFSIAGSAHILVLDVTVGISHIGYPLSSAPNLFFPPPNMQNHIRENVFDNCRCQHHKEGEHLFDKATGCPYKIFNEMTCQKAVLDGKN